MDMQTILATRNEKDELKKLWKSSFHYTQSFIDWYFEKAFVPEDTLIFRTETQIPAAASTLIPQTVMLGNKPVGAAYLSGLAMLPEYRSEENQTQQLIDTLTAAGERNFAISIMIPPNYKFYERFGWRVAYHYKQYDISPADLPAYRISGTVERPENTPETRARLSEIYQQFVQDKNGYTLRSDENWDMILEDLIQNFGGQCVLLKDATGTAIGYLLMIIRDKKMGIYEFAYKNRAAYESLIGFIASHQLWVETVSVKAAADDLSYLDFADRRDAVTLCPFAMARINNVEMALKLAAEEFTGSVRLQVIDRLIPENSKTFAINASEVTQTEEEPQVITDIGTLTQLFMGYISIKDAVRMNFLSGDAGLLTGMFRKKNNYINMLLI